jgi:hypothetical protein
MKGGKCSDKDCANYFVSGHACYFDNEKIRFDPNITLDFFTGKDECLKYDNTYLRKTCKHMMYKHKQPKVNKKTKSIKIGSTSYTYKKDKPFPIFKRPFQSYLPVYSITNEYYQMSFEGEINDDFEDIPLDIKCCDTDETIYKFYDETTQLMNRDLYLNEIIELIQLHNHLNVHKPKINISLFGCNMKCERHHETYPIRHVGVTDKLFLQNREGILPLPSNSLKQSRNASAFQVKNVMPLLQPKKRVGHGLKKYDSVLIKNWHKLNKGDQQVYKSAIDAYYYIKLNDYRMSANGIEWYIAPIDKFVATSDLYYVSPIGNYDYVMYNHTIYEVIGTRCENYSTIIHLLQKIYSEEEPIEVDNDQVLKIEYTPTPPPGWMPREAEPMPAPPAAKPSFESFGEF